MNAPQKKSQPVDINSGSINELVRAVAATKTRLDSEETALARLETRRANPEPDDTPGSLAAVDKQIAECRLSRDLAKANHKRAADALAAAEKLAAGELLAREAAEHQNITDALVKTLPAEMRARCEAVIALATKLHEHNKKGGELNKRLVAAGLEPLPIAEDVMRTVPPFGPRKHPVRPSPFAEVLEIPGFSPREPSYRVPGTARRTGIWIDSFGSPRQ